ncbi:hypothetical protein CS0771_28280 [Catellatospora sp. IY07-71]|uniref:DUF5691 domain-containing protein n=1 Tax=Catellatospora sp. IY07-71 TaxID=2728827 RepID=UPI001BB36EDD|nr:DUF5691 domain-containing protein [Catellatospora sp. IY07-71]BCJ73284.1 hypothetical protein CS0771_28280 [Catellatospora sp. IY07-71]
MTGEVWNDLLSSALVGTDRRKAVLPAVDGALKAVLPVGELDPESLLTAAAVVTVARRAGQQAARVAAPVPAPAETMPLAPAGAQDRLGRLLSGLDGDLDRATSRELAGEWLRLAADRGLRAAPQLLVTLLELGCAESSLRPLIRAAGGERLTWLCVEGPGRWAWAAETDTEPDPADWDTGRVAERAAYLAHLRERDPAAGRELLLASWPQEKAADLAVLVDACEAGLGPEDEPWLEKALDGRSGQVREAAVRLLAALPGSAYRQRMKERALAGVTAPARGRLEVHLPTSYDAGMRRDGVVEKTLAGVGERSHWLRQCIAAAPLDCWSAYSDSPEAFLTRQARQADDDWGNPLRHGLARAAIEQRDARWARALIKDGFLADSSDMYADLAAVLPADELTELVARRIAREGGASARLLETLPQPWPAPVCEAVLGALANQERRRSGWWQLLRQGENGFGPEYAPQVRALHDALPPTDQQMLSRFMIILQIRHDIHREFA